MNLSINVSQEDILQAVENLIHDKIDEDTFANEQAIASIIKNHLQVTIENIICNPEEYLNPEEKNQVDKCFYLTDYAYRKMMDRDIPYPPK